MWLAVTNPLLIDNQSSFALLWRVLQAFSSMSVNKLKSREFKLGDFGDQNSLDPKLMLASTSAAQSVPCMLALRPVGRRNLISTWSMEEHSSLKLFYQRQRLACSPFKISVRCYDATHHMIEDGWLVIDTLRYSEISFSNATTRSFCLLKTGSTMKVFS